MNKRECKRLFYKESVRSLLIAGWALGYISPNAINYVTKKLEKITKFVLNLSGIVPWIDLMYGLKMLI